MTLEQLRIFTAAASRLHMTRAAEALGLTQSAVSAAVAALEARYGVSLFDRVGRGLALSAAGEAFLPEALAVLARAQTAAQVLDDLAGLRRGEVGLFASQTIASYWLPPLMARFAQNFPEIALRLQVGNSAQVARAIHEGSAELGFVEGRVDDPALIRRGVGSDRLLLVAAPQHPLAAKARVQPADLTQAAWVLREKGSGTRSEFELALGEAGLDPAGFRVRLELPSNEAVLAVVASTDLLSAVSELAARSMIEAGSLTALEFPLPERGFALVTHKERTRSRAAAAFLAAL